MCAERIRKPRLIKAKIRFGHTFLDPKVETQGHLNLEERTYMAGILYSVSGLRCVCLSVYFVSLYGLRRDSEY